MGTSKQQPTVFAVGARVRVHKGVWANQVGVVDRLTPTVGGGRTTIVHVDPVAEGEKDHGFLPRTRLIVVDNQHLGLLEGGKSSDSQVDPA